VRAGFQTRAFEERFLTMGIPYRVIGGLRFYERREIRDAVAYLRVVYEPADDMAFERIINTPKRGIGQATMKQLHEEARAQGIPLTRATEVLVARGEIKGKLGQALISLLSGFARWRGAMASLPLGELLELVLEESGYRAMWQQEKSPDAAGRLENLRELSRAMGEFESVGDFLDHVGLVVDRDTQDTTDMVSLMTLHAAKGLEFDTVFLPGWEEGLFPHQKALDESGSKGLEEERRLAYVGITRARRRGIIIHAANRRIYNQWQSSIPSRFIAELPAAHVERMDGGVYGDGGFPKPMPWKNRVEELFASVRGGDVPSAHGFVCDERIFHQKFGYGRITAIQGDHLEIDFEKAGSKKVLAEYVKKASAVS